MPLPPVLTTPAEAVRATSVGGVLALALSVVGGVLAVWVSDWTPLRTGLLLALLALVAATGAVALFAPQRMTPALTATALVLGTAFLSLGMVIAGRAAVVGADNEMLFLVPVLFSAYFCRAWVVGLVVGTASSSYAAALVVLDVPTPAAPWLTTTSALAIAASLVFTTRARDVRLLAVTTAQVLRDPLTGLLNRRGLVEGGDLWSGGELCVLVADLDHFKAVNDQYGHLVGDEVLVLVANALSTGLRPDDVLARFGGEEFVLLLPGCRAEEGRRRAQELLELVDSQSRTWPVRISLSVGVAAGRRAEVDLHDLLSAADRALYAAKAAGRSTVHVDTSSAGSAPGSTDVAN